MRITERMVGLGVTGLLAACTAAPRASGPPLPFHVSILPIEPVIRAPRAVEGEEPTEMLLAFEPAELVERLARELEASSFVRVSSAAAFSDAADRDVGSDDLAGALAADLVLECELVYSPEIRRRRTVFVGLGWLLFALGGPLGIFLEEHMYLADVELRATFHDARALGDDVRIGDRAARVLPVQLTYPGLSTDMVDRADGMSDYALALLVPAGYIATESEHLQQAIRDDVTASLSRRLAEVVLERREAFVSARGTRPFEFASDELRLTRAPDGALRVEGEVRLLPGQVVERMSDWSLRVGETVVQREFGAGRLEKDPETGTRVLVYAFDAVVSVPEGATSLQLLLAAGTRDRFVGSFTFRIPERG